MMKAIKCPECGKLIEYSPANEYRPFCSQRCRLIDLGEWMEGNYRIDSEETDHKSDFLAGEFNTKH